MVKPTAFPTLATKSIIGMGSWQHVDRATTLASIVELAVSDCSVDFHNTGQLATLITKPVLLWTLVGSKLSSFPHRLAKSESG